MNVFFFLQKLTGTPMRLYNSSSSASVASRLYTNGARASGRGSFGSEPELLNSSDNENSMHELNEICNQVMKLVLKIGKNMMIFLKGNLVAKNDMFFFFYLFVTLFVRLSVVHFK